MKALVYHGPGKKSLDERPMPELAAPTDAIVRVDTHDDLRHRPAHPQGRRPDVASRAASSGTKASA